MTAAVNDTTWIASALVEAKCDSGDGTYIHAPTNQVVAAVAAALANRSADHIGDANEMVVRASSAPPCTPQSLHWLGERVEAEQTHHHPDMRGLVMYFDRQSDCLNFMRWLERQPSSPVNCTVPAVEIRRNEDTTIDEIVAENCALHIEQMTDDGWFMGIEAKDGSYWQFWFGSKNRKSHVEFRHTEMMPAEENRRLSSG